MKAQLIYFSTAAETLSVSTNPGGHEIEKNGVRALMLMCLQAIQGEIEETAVAAEAEYRQTRAA